MSEIETCDEQAAGYDGLFGVYCDRPKGHDGLHCDGEIEWRRVEQIAPSGRLISTTHHCGREE